LTKCELCGDYFDAYRSDARFCSDAHRAKATRNAAKALLDSTRRVIARNADELREVFAAAGVEAPF
jgi:hypothetical protein